MSHVHGASEACTPGLVRAFDMLGKRWNGLILSVLRDGPMKFSELRRGIGPITDSVLSDRLVELADFGVVHRCEAPGRPPQISYGLTASGRRLLPVLDDLGRWALDLETGHRDRTATTTAPASSRS